MRREHKNTRGVFSLMLFLLFFLVWIPAAKAQPSNDSCTQATVIAIPAGGYGLGTFTSAQADLTSATVQAGETFAPAIFVAGLNKKSVWYKFSIPTIRAVRVTLTQPGTTITAGDVGFAVYEATSCLPGNAQISTKLTPIVTFGNTYHPCVPSGDYYIQVSSNNNANGPIRVEIEISDQTGAAYDHPNQAFAFGQVKYYAQKIDFNTECQSIEDATEVCNAFAKPTDYNKSAWFTFTTPAYFDYIVVQLSGTGVSTYFPSNNNQATKRKFGYTLYQGNAVTTPMASLTTIQGCDSIETDGYYAAYKMYKCNELERNTTYTIQLFIKKDFGDDVRLGILVGGQGPSKGAKPTLSAILGTNAIGVLPSSPNGTHTQVDDGWGCANRHNSSVCGPALPDSGILHNNTRYNLSSFFTFTLNTTSAVNFNCYVTQCGPQPLIRLFKQGVTNNCTDLDTANIVGVFYQNGTIDCLEPGNYTVQISGQDYTDWFGRYHYGVPLYNLEQCLSTNLGTSFRLDLRAYTRKPANKFSLDMVGAVDSVNTVGNVMQPLASGTGYLSTSDTMGCKNTLVPSDTTCSPSNKKVIYREFVVADSGVVDFSNLVWSGTSWRYKLYNGDASALAWAQNVTSFPDKVTGLVAKTECLDGYISCNNKRACVVPGTYTFATMGGDADVGRVDQPRFTFLKTRTQHYSPATAQDLGSIMDTLGPGGGTIVTDVDYWSCTDNTIPINGFTPCTVGGKPATKAIYRQFYLKEAALVRIDNIYLWYCADRAFGTRTLFKGKATDGIAGLTPVGGGWSCFGAAGTTGGCDLLPAGWYTVVSYNQGPSYDSTFRSLNLEGRYNSSVSYNDEFKIIITPTCPGPKFNRPYRAAVDAGDQPFLITWGDRPGSTAAYPKRDSTYTLPAESFNCIVDTPFSSHPIKGCHTSSNRVAYYVFKTSQAAFIQVNAKGYYAALYDKDVRTDSALFGTLAPLQPCNNVAGTFQYCYFQPGTYTLVVFAGDGDACKSVAPSIFIEEIGSSRFDYAINAYDFDVVPPDSAFHYGKVGDVNPLDNGRKPSHDFFHCTTGATVTDPTESVCYAAINPNVYSSGPNKPLYDSLFPPSNTISRRNLWYTFVVNHGGTVKVKVEGKTPRRLWPHRFSIYSSNVDGTLSFGSVVSTGQVDSTKAQGLSFVVNNPIIYWPYYCSSVNNEISFFRDPCSAVPTRYYILVENVNGEPYENGGALPGTSIEVAILIDSVNLVLPKHDHYYQANDIGTVGVGTYTGGVDNYSCATKDPTDPIYYYNTSSQCRKTLWYKFTSTVTGNVRYRAYINSVRKYDYYDVQLFKEIKAGDSTTNGLQIQGYTGVYGADNTYWAQTCVTRGTYYILLTGCDQVGANVYPEIELIESAGDFCDRPVTAVLNGPGAVTASLVVNCHTIGTDYGEFGPQLTCPQGANTIEYKSSWFKMDIGGTDTLDVTTYLVESTNAASSDIKYRLMTGDCGAMQEQSCVLDALTQNTYQCLVPGQSYYVQVFTPVTKFNQQVTGTIDLKLSAIPHVDTCAPKNNCLANANFTSPFDCTTDTAVRFINYSTFGSSIKFTWDFGYNGQTSTAVSPTFSYPELSTAATYSVKLKVENLSCAGKDSIINTITIPGRPKIELGKDTVRCTSPASIVLDATTWNGSTYLWNTGATTPTITASSNGSNLFWVKGTYNGCITSDTVRVHINQVTAKKQTAVLCPAVDSIQLNSVRNQGEKHAWSNGLTTSSIWIKTPGTYYNFMNWNGCIIIDTFIIAAPNNPFPPDTSFCFSANISLDAKSVGAVSYQWHNGSTNSIFNVPAPGQYWVQINYPTCNVRDTINVTGLQPVVTSTNAAICSGQTYTLPSGMIVSAAGTYSDTTRSVSGCDSVITSVVLGIQATLIENTSIAICSGATYMLPWGTSVNAGGVYTNTIKYANGGCDSLVQTVTITVKDVLRNSTAATICAGQSHTLPSGIVVSLPATYTDTLKYTTGCDSVITTTTLTVKPLLRFNDDVTLCDGQSYTFPSGITVTAPGVYNDTVSYTSGCDSLISVINITIKSLTRSASSVSICEGQTYTLPSGSVVTSGGTYIDTIQYAGGCDSLITTVALVVKAVTRNSKDTVICSGQVYTLPSGKVVNTSDIYVDTLKYAIGCDSVITTTSLTVKPLYRFSDNVTLCEGQSYILPSGKAVTAPGVYNDTIAYTGGCDSLISVVNVAVKSLTRITSSVSICHGQTHTLPSGSVVSSGGTYVDTLPYAGGCDSLITTVLLVVKEVTRIAKDTFICAGQNYSLPSGKVVNTTDIFIDTVRYLSGCDSLISTVNLTVKPVSRVTATAIICPGETYTLPSGKVVSSTGTYEDTLYYPVGCDSLITTVTLTVKPVTRNATTATICQDETYALPSGKLVAVQGLHIDTIKYVTGCDSLITTVSLVVNNVTRTASSVTICSGKSYTLPSGVVVSNYGVHVDTLKYTTGCDSLISTIDLSIKTLVNVAVNAVICDGQTFIAPSGTSLHLPGVYKDTLKYVNGCDSIITIINLTVKGMIRNIHNQTICAGQSYTLPSGRIVNAAGSYADTLFYNVGCDSVINTINLVVKPVTRLSSNASICAGQSYTFPSGKTAGTAGTYSDTVRYVTGCDSLISTITLISKAITRTNTASTICEGQLYILPSGKTVTSQGIYLDTLQYTSGCDSLIITHSLTVKPVSRSSAIASICLGETFTMPSGKTINATGTYNDTIRYRTGCDSLITNVSLNVYSPSRITLAPSICAGESYTLPSGMIVSNAGTYTDVIKNQPGCDSLITTIQLVVNANPVIWLSKTSDINCVMGSTTLTATGGSKYRWYPPTGLSNPYVYNPVAAPQVTTVYKAEVTSGSGCISVDSIQVKVNPGSAEGGYVLPSAFTPNGDGKNDCFGVKAWGWVSNLQMNIYDRWGNVIYTTSDPSRCWDGTYKGSTQGTGAYLYSITATTICGPIVRKGTIVLIR